MSCGTTLLGFFRYFQRAATGRPTGRSRYEGHLTPATREQIYQALFDLTASLSPSVLKTRARVIKHEADVDREHQPALFQVQVGEGGDQLTGTPERRLWDVWWVIYTNRGESDQALPSTDLNNVLDALDGVLAPPAGDDAQTLGGLVVWARRSGRTEISEAPLGQQAVTIYPIQILVPVDFTC